MQGLYMEFLGSEGGAFQSGLWLERLYGLILVQTQGLVGFFFFFWEWAWPYSFLGAGNSSYSSKAIRKVAGGYLGYLATFPPWRAEMAVIAIRTQAIREVFWLGPDWWNSLDWGLASSVPWGFTKYTL
jgi:hypothetical protein